MEPSATSTTVIGPVGERLQAGTEDAPVLDRTAPLRHFRNSGARYKYPDLLLTYLLTYYKCFTMMMMMMIAELQEKYYSYRCETFRTDVQRLW